MKNQTQTFSGPAGYIDCTFSWPRGVPCGWALVLHPHPLQGGSRENKVVTTIARACNQHNLITICPNFRGVGASEGTFDNSLGETTDMLSLVSQVRACYKHLTHLPWVVAGFSFGSAVAAQLYVRIKHVYNDDLVALLILVGTAIQRYQVQQVEIPENTLIIHGENDEIIPLKEIMDWVFPHSAPVVIIPKAGHFFHGRLLVLRRLVSTHLKAKLN